MFVVRDLLYDEAQGEAEHAYPAAHPYLLGLYYAVKRIARLAPCKVLDIGSPLAQIAALAAIPGIEMSVMDIRPYAEAEKFEINWIHGNATSIPFPDASWSVFSSLWVMGHVGDGRYGDALDVDGDVKMIREMGRVLKSGGTAILGPGMIDKECGNIFNIHRIYSWEWLQKQFDIAGLDLVEKEDFEIASDLFIDPTWDGVNKVFTPMRRPGYYGVCVLRKR